MCSTFKFKDCVGRNFDFDVSYKEQLIQIPKYTYFNIYDVIGIASGVTEKYPLMYDGINSKGLVCTALAFNGNADYKSLDDDEFETKDSTASVKIKPFEFVFGILSGFESVEEVKRLLKKTIIVDEDFSTDIKNSDLHWFIADKKESIIVEQTKDGLKIYDGDVMTNNPPYPLQKELWDNFKKLIGNISFKNLFKGSSYDTRGLETYDLNGDYTSFGRFQRLSFLKEKMENANSCFDEINQSFHLLNSVEQVYGATPVDDKYEYTIYSVVYDMKNLAMYVKTYDDALIYKHTMKFENEERWDL